MSSFKLLKPNYNYEALCILEKIVTPNGNPSNPWQDMSTVCESLRNKFTLSEQEFERMFAPLIQIYNYVKDKIGSIPDSIKPYFEQLTNSDTSIARICLEINRYTENHPTTSIEQKNTIIAQIILLTLETDEISSTIEYCNDSEGLLRLINLCKISDSEKFKCMRLLNDFNTVSDEIYRYIKLAAKFMMEKSMLVDPIIAEYEQFYADKTLPELVNFFKLLGVGIEENEYLVYPSIIHFAVFSLYSYPVRPPFSQDKQIIHIGIWVHVITRLKDIKKDTSQLLVSTLKAMSDTNRLNILLYLRSGRKYAQELMQFTGLTSATISHHMSELISSKLVSVEKIGQRVYYSLEHNMVIEITKLLNSMFNM